LRGAIHGLKFQSRRNLASLLGPLLAATFLDSWERSEVDLVLPIPLHPRRQRERGFNQAALLARSMTRLLALPYDEKCLERTRATAPQAALTNRERLRNMAGAFECRRPAEVRKRRVLLIDDVMTTGATVAGAARALLECGAHRVSVLTVARAVIGME
jgi:ComF family protein